MNDIFDPSALRRVLARFPDAQLGGRGRQTSCPAHEHGEPPGLLTISHNGDGAVDLECGMGCDLETILDYAQLDISDLQPGPGSNSHQAHPANHRRTSTKPHPAYVTGSDIKPRKVEWLWPGYLPLGKICLLDGDPGTGKSTLAIDLAARVSTGRPMPGREDTDDPADVVMLSAEDGKEDTVIPRFIAAGGDLKRIHFLSSIPDSTITTRPLIIPTDVDHIGGVIAATDSRLLVIDVLMAFFARSVNTFRDQDVRCALHPLVDMADLLGCTVLCLRHLNKNTQGASAIYRGGGSIGIVGAARSVLMAGKNPEPNSTDRILAVAKSNLAALPASLSYQLETVDEGNTVRVAWLGQTDMDADTLVATPDLTRKRGPEPVLREEAAEWLRESLAEGAVPIAVLLERAEEEGFSRRTIYRAAKEIGVRKPRRGQASESRSTWELSTGK